MIIFDLDGTLADCEHRRHFIIRNIGCDHWHQIPNHPVDMCNDCKDKHKKWRPDWKSFFDACDEDKPIEPSIQLFKELYESHAHTEIQIWSARCESVKKKTLMWLDYHIKPTYNFFEILKMRPIGDNTPDEQLKECWLDEVVRENRTVDFVFDDRPKVIRMWRRRGIFVFDVNQTGKEF